VVFIAENGVQLWDETSNTRMLLYEADDVNSLAFSDDQQLLAFTRRNEQHQISLWVMDAGGQGARELLSAADLLALNLSQIKDLAVDPYSLAWIPGTHRLAFSTRTLSAGDDPPDVFQELRVIDADTGSLEELISDARGGTYTFSPDGTFIVRASDTSVGLFTAGGELVVEDIVTYPALGLGGYYYHPPIHWDEESQTFILATINTADSLEVAYNPDVKATIYRAAVDGSLSELATMTGMTLDHAFSPDLDMVAFMRPSPKGLPLREMHIADVRNTWDIVYREGETLSFGQWNPSAETYQFIFSDGWADPGIGRLCLPAEPLPSVSGPGYTRRPQWVDAARYLYLALPQGDLYLGSADGSQKLVGRMAVDRVSGEYGPLENFDVYLPGSQTPDPLPSPAESQAAGGPSTVVELEAELQMPASLPSDDVVKLTFSLTNHADEPVYLLKWFTPLEGIGGDIFRISRDGQLVPYQGILASRSDPAPDAYVLLEAGETVSAEVDLAQAYDFSQAGTYTIAFISPRISHVARTEAEMAKTLEALGPVEIPANEVAVTIHAPAGGDLQNDVDMAQETLARYFALLSQGRYAEAVGLYVGPYDVLQEWNPTADPEEYAGLFEKGCTANGLHCLPVKQIIVGETASEGRFSFTVTFENPDGSLFVLDPEGAVPRSEFDYTVVRLDDGYFVEELPVYAP
jgi:hypothetical protein